MKYIPILLLLFATSCSLLPIPFDSNVNQKLAEIKANAMDLQTSCEDITFDMVHTRLVVPAMTLQAMTTYRNEQVAKAANGAWKTVDNFELRIQAASISGKHVSETYCKDKLNDVVLTVNAIMKPYGTL